MPVGHLCIFFGEMSISVCCPFLVGLFVFFDIELYALVCISVSVD